jgi:hypothetical protein
MQLPLTFRPASHVHDPSTSRAAEAAVTKNGQRRRDLDVVVAAVRAAPGRTASGYAALLEWDIYKVRRRLTDGKAATLLRQGDKVRVQGRSCAEVTWWPVEGT